MAQCPKCNKPVPYYKSLTHTKWTGIKCNYCGSVAFIKRNKTFNFFVYFIPAIVICVIVINFIEGFKKQVIVLIPFIFLVFLIDAAIIWGKTKLEVRDKCPR